MRKLTIKEISKFAKRKNVRKIAVENFLMSMGTNINYATGNLYMDANAYGWNDETVKAIRDGIKLAIKRGKEVTNE